MISASSAQHAEVVGAGTQTTVLPAAMAGANSSAPIVYGQFHGLMTPTTPSGTDIVSTRRDAEVDGGAPPGRRIASSAAIRKYSASSVTSSRASAASGLPWSSASSRARSSARSSITAATTRQQAARSKADSAAQDGPAAPAAATASSTSAGLATATEANVAPDAGPTAGIVPARPSRQVPPTQIEYSRMGCLPPWGRPQAPAHSRPRAPRVSGRIRNSGPEMDSAATQAPAGSKTGAATATSPSSSSAIAVA